MNHHLTLHDSQVVNAHVPLADDLVAETSRACLRGVLRLVLGVSKTDEILMVGVHVSQLVVNHQNQLLFALLLALSNVSGDDSFGFLAQSRIAIHFLSATPDDIRELDYDQIDAF